MIELRHEPNADETDVLLCNRTKRQMSEDLRKPVICVIIVASCSVRISIVSHIPDDLKQFTGELIIAAFSRSFGNGFQIGEGRPEWNLNKARLSGGDRARVVPRIKKASVIERVEVLLRLSALS